MIEEAIAEAQLYRASNYRSYCKRREKAMQQDSRRQVAHRRAAHSRVARKIQRPLQRNRYNRNNGRLHRCSSSGETMYFPIWRTHTSREREFHNYKRIWYHVYTEPGVNATGTDTEHSIHFHIPWMSFRRFRHLSSTWVTTRESTIRTRIRVPWTWPPNYLDQVRLLDCAC